MVSGSNQINARDGDDQIFSGNGNDVITTGNGSDYVLGAGGNDVIRTGDGNDTVDTGAGKDQVIGGAGADRFVMSTLNDKDYVRILDFKASDGDKIFVDIDVFTALNIDTFAQQFIANNTGVATTSAQRMIFDTRNGNLYYDPDGSGSQAADHIATLVGVNVLHADQIFLSTAVNS